MKPFEPGDVVPVTGRYVLVWGVDLFPKGQAFLREGGTFPAHPFGRRSSELRGGSR
jgi:hypothetical protein